MRMRAEISLAPVVLAASLAATGGFARGEGDKALGEYLSPNALPVIRSRGDTKASRPSSVGPTQSSSRSWANTGEEARQSDHADDRGSAVGRGNRRACRVFRRLAASELRTNGTENREEKTVSSNRRQFLTQISAFAAASSFPMPALAQAKPKLVVVGGGPGGATIAKYVAKDSNGAVEVTLVEPLRQFTTCFHSNLYLGGFRNWGIDHAFLRCIGIQVRREAGASGGAGDRSREEERPPRRRIAARLRSAGGGARDRHQLNSVPGYSEAASESSRMRGRPSSGPFKRKINSIKNGGVIVMNRHQSPPLPPPSL